MPASTWQLMDQPQNRQQSYCSPRQAVLRYTVLSTESMFWVCATSRTSVYAYLNKNTHTSSTTVLYKPYHCTNRKPFSYHLFWSLKSTAGLLDADLFKWRCRSTDGYDRILQRHWRAAPCLDRKLVVLARVNQVNSFKYKDMLTFWRCLSILV